MNQEIAHFKKNPHLESRNVGGFDLILASSAKERRLFHFFIIKESTILQHLDYHLHASLINVAIS